MYVIHHLQTYAQWMCNGTTFYMHYCSCNLLSFILNEAYMLLQERCIYLYDYAISKARAPGYTFPMGEDNVCMVLKQNKTMRNNVTQTPYSVYTSGMCVILPRLHLHTFCGWDTESYVLLYTLNVVRVLHALFICLHVLLLVINLHGRSLLERCTFPWIICLPITLRNACRFTFLSACLERSGLTHFVDLYSLLCDDLLQTVIVLTRKGVLL